MLRNWRGGTTCNNKDIVAPFTVCCSARSPYQMSRDTTATPCVISVSTSRPLAGLLAWPILRVLGHYAWCSFHNPQFSLVWKQMAGVSSGPRQTIYPERAFHSCATWRIWRECDQTSLTEPSLTYIRVGDVYIWSELQTGRKDNEYKDE